MHIPLLTLCTVFLLIAIRQIGNVRLQIWQIMAGGALIVLTAGSISPSEALAAIDIDVMLFLFGMFVVGQALEESGYLAHVSYRYFKRASDLNGLLFLVIFGTAFASAFLMNDTLAIIGTPVILLLARKHDMSPKILLLGLCFAVTIGSVMSPIGNPQNLLVAVHGGIANPFVSFFRWLFIPTVINLFLCFWLLRRMSRDEFHTRKLDHSQEPIHDRHLALLSRISLQMILALVALKIVLVIVAPARDFRLTTIAIAACLPIILGSPKRLHILRRIDWPTLAFFASMFVLMESVWQSGFFQGLITQSGMDIVSVESILAVSVSLSQLISNVPLVALVQPLLLHAGAGERELMALAAGSTIAGNLFILGAASNVIVIQNAERRSHTTITFLEFARVGIPLTILQTGVYWAFLRLF